MSSNISACSHVVSCRWLVGSDEDIGCLARAEHDDRRGEWLEVGGISSNNCHLMAGNSEEELIVECSIDDSEKACFTRVYWNHNCVCITTTNLL